MLSALGAGACGKQIGDNCIVGSDCSTNGTRQCDTSSKGGYCTIQGCDLGTCPTESTCVRFFTGAFANRPCDPRTEDVPAPGGANACSLDELCTLDGQCAPRASEVRYCMLTCASDSDCRDGYECRTLDLMKAHGGEPLLEAGMPVDDKSPKFCAVSGR